MFNQESFKVFDIAGLEPRMAAIQEQIQPVFLEIGELMRERIAEKMAAVMPDETFYLHIAQHRRRTANAPDNTWCAISTKKRGYKMEPHFQLGIWQDYVFVYLSIIDQPKEQKLYAERLSELTDWPENLTLSKDHTRPETFDLSELTAAIERLQTVKKSELEIGRIWSRAQFDGKQDDKILKEMLATLDQLIPIYERLLDGKN